ncbi:hypothetical protein QR685DRAFT_568605 [Neurospora intermedia]|uniref:J domain-containing protein n=1 Tax=Neurospora intermedia TaxID=5142 RepID=A0ABR3DTD4_NEUIN
MISLDQALRDFCLKSVLYSDLEPNTKVPAAMWNLFNNHAASSLNRTCLPALMPWTVEEALCRRTPLESIVHSSCPSSTSLPIMSTTTYSSCSSASTPLIPLTHYQALNVPYSASNSDTSTAFHAFCKFHRQPGPDKIPHFTSSQRYRDLKEAYDMLIDSEDRQKYDLFLAKKGVPEMVEKFKGKEEKEMERETDKKMERETDEKKMERMINEYGEEVLEGWGQDEVIKFIGRPRGPKVRGTNV